MNTAANVQGVEPLAWMREWDGDVSDLGSMLFEDGSEQPCDGYEWEPLYTAASLAAITADRDRLNWLDAQWQDGVHVEVCAKGDGIGNYRPNSTVYHRQHEGTQPDIRAAIDAARKALESQ